MSYPPSYPGYPSGPSAPPHSGGYPPSSSSGGIGFESMMNPPSQPSGYGQPAAPYPPGNNMPVPGFGAPAPAHQPFYGAPSGMPSPAAPSHMPIPPPTMGFGRAANTVQAAMAFQAPFRTMPAPNPNVPVGYNAPPYGNNNSFSPGTAPVVQPATIPTPHNTNRHASSFHGFQQNPIASPTAPHDGRHSSFHGSAQAKPTSSTNATSTAPSQTVRSDLATVKPYPSFKPQVDAEAIRKAIGGFGTNIKEIINILSTRSNSQRLKIALEYKSQFGRDLKTDLEYALGGTLENLLLAMMQPPSEYDAAELRTAMKGLGTNESVLIEVLCSRTNAELAAVKQGYRKKFERDLEKDVQSETSGNFRKFLTSLTQANRDESTNVDYGRAQADASDLYEAGEKRWGTDEARFNVIFASRSYAHLRATFNEYAKISKYDIEKSVEREMSGDLKNAMSTLVKCVRNTPAFFAYKLYKSMKGLGTDDATLIRVIVTRCEVDMVSIKQEFQKMYKKTLADFIKGDTSGNYRKTLLGLIGEGEK